MCFVLHFCIFTPEPSAALVLTRLSRDLVLLLARRATADGTRFRGRPPAAAVGAESHHLFSPKRLRAWVGGAAEGAWGGGEEEQHLLLLHASETPLRRRPQQTAWFPKGSLGQRFLRSTPLREFRQTLWRGAAQLLQPAPIAAGAAEEDGGVKRCCSPARRSLEAVTMLCHPRRAGAVGATLPTPAPPQAAAPAPPPFLSLNPFPAPRRPLFSDSALPSASLASQPPATPPP